MKLKQIKPLIISHDHEHFLVTVKKKKYNDESTLNRLKLTLNHNVVDLMKIFHDKKIIYMIYECMKVSLKSLSFTSKRKLKHFKIAAMCKEI